MGKRILLCDDEVHILRAAEFKLRRAGFDVQTASDGQAAWELIQQQCPDVLITDCQMPRMNGLELIERVRGCEQTQHLPVMMLTAKGFELPVEQLRKEWNVLEVIAKPFSPRQLLEKVEAVLAAGASYS